MTATLETIAEALRDAQCVAIASHVSPDGDTIGSALAIRLALMSLGKEVNCFCADKVPDQLSFLPGAECYRNADDAEACKPDLALAVDCADRGRLGGCAVLLDMAAQTAQVDHHGTNTGYCELNHIEGDAPADALPVLRLIKMLGVPLSREIAICLYTGLSTDTGNFAFDSTNPEAFEAAAELLACDLPLGALNRRLFRERSRAQLELIGRAISSIRFSADGTVSVMKLTLKDFEAASALPEHSDTIVNFGLDITGVKLAALLRETPDGQVKASLRALPPMAVDGIAQSLGGGGHALAAGCTMQEPLDSASDRLMAMLTQLSEAHPA